MQAAARDDARVTDSGDPRVADYADLRGEGAHPDRGLARRGLLMAEGDLVVRQLLRSRYRVRSVLGTPRRLGALADALVALNAPIYEAERGVMNELVGFDIHRGVLAAADRGEPASLGTVLQSARSLVVLEDLANHDNMGGIFRNVAALAPGGAVVLSPGCCDPLYRKAIRVSLGHALHVPFARALDWPADLIRIAAAGFTTIGLAPGPGCEDIGRVRAARPALLLGAEGPGLTRVTMGCVQRRVTIPMPGGADSLNVSVACGIALHRCPA
ncbi:MAG: RNA methyltransferase [Phycisphaerales bacterium]|nr:RNA methyltransferase [Phycisphaerales bacterium]